MATVGNLFVNVRGRTSGLVRDMKKANRQVSKDFYRNEAMARERYTQAISRVQSARGMSPAVRDKRLREADVARRQFLIARNRPGRLAQRRELMARKERGQRTRAMLAREAKAIIPWVLGVPAAVLAFAVKRGVDGFRQASQFAVAGPSGGQFIEAKVGKVLDDLAFAQRPDASRVMARQAQLERETAILWREVGLQFQVVMNLVLEEMGLDTVSPGIKGDPGFVPGQIEDSRSGEMHRRAEMRKARAWLDQAFWMFD